MKGYFDFHGLMLVQNDDGSLGYGSYHDPQETEFAYKLFRPGDRILVAGGGMGSTSMLLGLRYGAENIVTYEANPYLVSMMSRGLWWNDIPMTVVHAAIAGKTGMVKLKLADHWVQSTICDTLHGVPVEGTEVEVPSVRINDILREHAITAACLDIEGAEADVLRDLDFSRLGALVIELHGTADDVDAMTERIKQHMTVALYDRKFPECAVVGAVR